MTSTVFEEKKIIKNIVILTFETYIFPIKRIFVPVFL